MKRFLFLAVLYVFSTIAVSAVYLEDFEYTPPANQAWFTSPDGIFYHQTGSSTPSPSLHFVIDDLSQLDNPPIGQGLLLWDGFDYISFNLNPGQYVESVSVDFVCLQTHVRISVIGSEYYNTWYFYPNNNIWETFDTTGIDFGEITEIRIGTEEAAFDNITINVVPEPATMVLLALGTLALRRENKLNT